MLFTLIISPRIYIKIILVSLFLYASNCVSAQIVFNTDSAYAVAREMAFSGKRAEARLLLRDILKVKPENAELQTLLGRIYSWDRKYDSARMEFTQVLTYSPKNEDATNALLDTELWSENYSEALLISEKALRETDPRSESFLLKKASALFNLKRYNEASVTVHQLLKINPKNNKGIALGEHIKKESRINKIGVSYDHDRFSSAFSPWSGVSAFYSRKTKALGTIIGRVNYAKRFGDPGVQYEADFYPRLSKKLYSYFNAGFSNSDIFPSVRMGFSLYRRFPNSFEGEIGMRYLKFNNSTFIYTGALSKYISNFLFSVRPSFIYDTVGSSRSVSLISRYYMKGSSDNHLTLTLSAGVAPDEFNKDLTLARTPNVGSKAIAMRVQHVFLKQFILSTGAAFRKNEYTKGLFRNNFNFSTGLEMFF